MLKSHRKKKVKVSEKNSNLPERLNYMREREINMSVKWKVWEGHTSLKERWTCLEYAG